MEYDIFGNPINHSPVVPLDETDEIHPGYMDTDQENQFVEKKKQRQRKPWVYKSEYDKLKNKLVITAIMLIIVSSLLIIHITLNYFLS
jgi:hypothetical protein